MSKTSTKEITITVENKQKIINVISFLKSTFEKSFEDLPLKEINSLDDVENNILQAKNLLRAYQSKIIDQAEEQIIDLKTSILSLNETLPIDPLNNTGVHVFNTSKNKLLSALKTSKALNKSSLGTSINSSHIHYSLTAYKSIHGIFIFHRLGDSEEHAVALNNFASFAHKNCFQIYFNVDNASVLGLKKYSDLPEQLSEWTKSYKKSKFFKKLSTIKPDHKRRLTNVFNDFIINTDRLERQFPEGSLPKYDEKFINKVCYAPPVSLMAKLLIKNFEELGWAGRIFGHNSLMDIISYTNHHPSDSLFGRSFSTATNNKYSLTLWNYTNHSIPELRDNCRFTPLQRQPFVDPEKNITEKILFAEAQTLLEIPKDFINYKPSDFEKIKGKKRSDHIKNARRAMFNSLTTALVEDMIFRGILLITYKYIGETETVVQGVFKHDIEDYMTVYCNKRKENETQYDKKITIKALKNYEILDIGAKGDYAFVQLSISPNETIRRIEIEIDTPPAIIQETKKQGGERR